MASTAAWDDDPPPGSVSFFVQRMNEHERVRSVRSLSPNRHNLTLDDGTEVKVFLTDTYTFSVSDLALLQAKHPDVNCVVSASSWNHFTDEVRKVARADEIGTFYIGEVMGALHYRGDAFLNYAQPEH